MRVGSIRYLRRGGSVPRTSSRVAKVLLAASASLLLLGLGAGGDDAQAGSVGAAPSAAPVAAPAAPARSQIVMRRLTEGQYRQSITDIFGQDIQISERFEPDPRRDGLIAIGVANTAIGAAGFERYDSAAREIAAQVTGARHRRALVGCESGSTAAASEACAREFLARTGRLLFRRPIDGVELDRFASIHKTAAAQKKDFYAGLSAALATMLVSPQYLFRIERAVPDGNEMSLDDWSIASRLSFLIWNAPPDNLLLSAAERGELRTSAGLLRQAERLLVSPRFEAGVSAFFADMLALDSLAGIQKDSAIYPRFNSRLALDAREQTLRTIAYALVRRNEDYRSLFTSRRTFMSRSLGLLYAEPVSAAQGWEIRELGRDDPRVGILAQPAFLMAHSHPGISSPTLRGAAIRELLLCQRVPAPPGNVDFTLFQNTKDTVLRTARQRLDAHNENPVCAGCHKLTDPLGLPLEGFDGTGGMRTEENGSPLDLGGQHAGRNYTAAAGLGAALGADPALVSCMAERLYAYGTGHSTDAAGKWSEAVQARFEPQGSLRMRDLIRALVQDARFFRVEGDPRGSAISLTFAGASK